MAVKMNEIKGQIDASLHDTTKPWTSIFDKAEAKTGIKRLYIFLGAAGFVALWLIFGYAGELVCNSIGFLYPAYTSIKAIESPRKDDDTKWLMYWVVYAHFAVLEYFSDIFVSWFPLYWLAKCTFLVWCMIPTQFNGSIVLYNNFIRHYFNKHHGSIDNVMNEATNLIKNLKPE